MANWCSNTVQFDCDSQTMEKLVVFFDELQAKGEKEDCGQLPPFY